MCVLIQHTRKEASIFNFFVVKLLCLAYLFLRRGVKGLINFHPGNIFLVVKIQSQTALTNSENKWTQMRKSLRSVALYIYMLQG